VEALETGFPTACHAADLVVTGLTAPFVGAPCDFHRLPAWLLSAWSRLERSFPSAPGIGRLAEEVGVSREHLSRSFRTFFGLSMSAYVGRRRLEYGATRLRESGASISSIAYSAGFSDQSHFTRRFRSYFGITPARFREGARRSGDATVSGEAGSGLERM